MRFWIEFVAFILICFGVMVIWVGRHESLDLTPFKEIPICKLDHDHDKAWFCDFGVNGTQVHVDRIQADTRRIEAELLRLIQALERFNDELVKRRG